MFMYNIIFIFIYLYEYDILPNILGEKNLDAVDYNFCAQVLTVENFNQPINLSIM